MKRPRQKKLGTERESKQEGKQRRHTVTLQTLAIKKDHLKPSADTEFFTKEFTKINKKSII